MTITRAIVVGLLIALIGQLISVPLAGAGEGWVSPLFVSPVLWIAYPFVLARAVQISKRGARSTWPELAALAVAVAADVHLAFTSWNEGNYVLREHRPGSGEGFVEVWAVIWLGWQFLAVRNLPPRNDHRPSEG
jgi:hypothetical protein